MLGSDTLSKVVDCSVYYISPFRMSEDPGHKAMLYFLEVLMNSNGPLTISQLAGRFGSRSFSADMRSAAGGNETGLKKFLLKYPSLFTVNGNMVSLFDSSKAAATPLPSDDTAITPSGFSLPDVSAEMEAVRFFQGKLLKKEERWVPIKSLAGHLSQASAEVRNCVGPQLEFRKWLLRHPHIFEVQGELVGMRDGIAAMATPTIPRKAFETALNGIDSISTPSLIPPKTPPATRKFPPRSPAPIRRSQSFSEKRMAQLESQTPILPPSTPGTRRRNAPVTMTANEYKAVMYLKDILEKRGPLKLHNITGHFSQAPEGVRNTIGWTKMELEDFLKRNANVFYVSEDETVSVIKNAKLNVIITGSRPQSSASIRTLQGRKGKIFHVAKLWGIIDLGKHEHVFFDKSIMQTNIDDLQKHYHVGEWLYFNAVLAPKTSRAKWRATQVWKEHEAIPNETEDLYQDDDPLSPSMSIEEEINRFLPQYDYDTGSNEDLNSISMTSLELNDLRLKPTNYTIALPYPNGNIDRMETPPVLSPPMTPVMREVATNVSSSPPSDASPAHTSPSVTTKKYVDTACQTISTGDIIATQLYQENV